MQTDMAFLTQAQTWALCMLSELTNDDDAYR
ncbi:hypothetical protein GSU75_04446 [Pseudomonas savastanoi pv. phaseolicola]|uniref:Uncharacterized protein n=1 Tax=Pseudomonas syringae TaxID=317 RepID=A0A2K4WZ65_PSESX|nr:hypothetical protein [Pseudomonas savastanoi pv. phaseolicola]SOS22669.1 hypothetical protein CFBP6109_04923 [Pseudomonas syringae pv. cerasicola]SOS41177.1 hypothetical protein CFBP3840_04153 [Pseudomonas syringae]MBN4183401.1 hypothetical protein [Pseudomonas savastanoi pv. phaseolicola]SPD80892.1 hypothetical protein PSCFBP2116_01356 [Pseudomonas syringae]